MKDSVLLRRSIHGFGEMVAALGRWGVGVDAEIRQPDAIGARIDVAADNPWFNAAVVPLEAAPPVDTPQLPYCLWTVAQAVPGRVENTAIAMPCMGIHLPDALKLAEGAQEVAAPSLHVLGDVNERAYGQPGVFVPLIRALRDDRVGTYGLRDRGVFVCVALTLTVDDDVSIQYVATDAAYRRRGLASQLLRSLLVAAQNEGRHSATLQASADGVSVYERLGFRRLALLRGYVRSGAGG